LSAEDVHNLTSHDDKSRSLVIEWLAENGIAEHNLAFSTSGDWITLHLSIEKTEDLLATQYYMFHDEDVSIVRINEWSLPVHLHDHVDCIQPTTSYFGASAKAQRRDNGLPGVLSRPSVSLQS
jgi:tripeptidyl-peptidase-1